MPTHLSRHASRRTAQTVTDARSSGDDDRVQRMKRYLVAMGVRTLSFPVAVWAFVQEYYVLAGVLAVLAAVIPSFAVMLANAVDRRQAPQTEELLSPMPRLGPASTPPPSSSPPTGSEIITGTVVSSEETAAPVSGRPTEDEDAGEEGDQGGTTRREAS